MEGNFNMLKIVPKICLIIVIITNLITLSKMTLALINNNFDFNYIFYLIINFICLFICYMNYKFSKEEF